MARTITEAFVAALHAAEATKPELADACGVSVTTIDRWRNGSAVPSIYQLPAVMAALDKTIDELFPELMGRDQ